MISPATSLHPEEATAPGYLDRLVTFARLLRDNGFDVGPSDVTASARAMAAFGLPTSADLRRILSVLFCRRRTERDRFNDIFDAFWLNKARHKRTLLRDRLAAKLVSSQGEERATQAMPGGGLAQYFDWVQPNASGDAPAPPSPASSSLGGASGIERSMSADFGKVVDPDEAEALMALADRLGAKLRYRISRRLVADRKGATLDLRRTMRASLGYGGDLILLSRKKRKKPPVSLVLFVDVSGSMDAYSLFFMRFAHAMSGGFRDVQTFIFHTRLVHVSGALKEGNPVRMMEKLALMSNGWSGGTRIGDALATFNDRYAKHHCNSRTFAVILSDGYDTGDAAHLASGLRQLKRHCQKIIWLNPLLGRDSYQPVAAGMAAALRYVTLFASAHNLSSLMKLEDAIATA